MCHNIKTLSQNLNGHFAFCKNCKVYHLYFNNLFFEFTPRELKAFKKFVAEINVDYWESCCQRALLKRRIPIQTMQHNLAMVFNQQELESLKDLIFKKTIKPNEVLKDTEIDYTLFLS